ncbi:piggyBac transposable element-derived protein 3-like [Colias croceus]|uniref:piggyBac transposable element-derived protein 3-like n=1 Tax=Colias crocea TaxID=72248 RepID=UPI001E27A97A|nr:piggyBac transposable element-derived protein 3-like [Colias croceus]XP_045503262.1 piggyBac transposable element-derived protein 3-like [Colias croceus]XP_045505459.1 piggyBac transposable element-derived protein 3-like [Colias croceus]XP_045505834.1 piggyBac transposable element-derived protein 3-like [Colias croceus]
MAAFFDNDSRSRLKLTDDMIADLLNDGNNSELEDFDEDDLELFDQDVLFRQTNDENHFEGEQVDEVVPESSFMSPSTSATPVVPQPSPLNEIQIPPTPRNTVRASKRSRQGNSTSATHDRSSLSEVVPEAVRGRVSASAPRATRKRVWKQTTFAEKAHDYPALQIKPVRRPIDYFNDYFDTEFLEEVSRCTNVYFLRTTGRELKCTSAEIAKLFAAHIIMGCISFPRLPMYWRAGTRLELVSRLMSRDRFLVLRNALHVIDSDIPAANDTGNPLWKVQPMIDKVKQTCNKLERVPGFYSIDEQMIPFTGRCQLRQVVKNKPRPVGLKNFVLTTSEGLMLDFEIYRGARSTIGDSSLGLGPSVILHLVQKIPPGSCVYHDRYFTTVALIEEMDRLGLHSTGTIMQNRIPDRTTLKFKKDSEMQRGETQQFVCEPTAIVKWKDNKSVLLASNCTAGEDQSNVKRWNKQQKTYVDVPAPKVVRNYNQYMGGVDVLDQQMEYYRAFIKTKKWTLKVLIHFLDLALVNSWRLYRNDCLANKLPRKESLALLDFRLNVADSLSCIPDRLRREENEDDLPSVPRRHYKIFRPANAPSEAKRYDGYEHYPVFDDIKAPRCCRMEGCGSRSKIKCAKCDGYLCLSRDKNCFMSYHVKNM